MDITIIIPSYKGAEVLENNLPYLISHLDGLGKSYEIIIVDDGSQDEGKTEDVATKFKCLFFRHDKNLGKGASVRKGMLHARGQFTFFTDVDIPFEFRNFVSFLDQLEIEGHDLVIGDRNLEESSYFYEISYFRTLGSTIFSKIVNILFFSGIMDTQCGLKGFRKNISDDLFSVSRINGFSFDVEILYVATMRGYKVIKLPVILRCQESESVNLLIHGTEMVLSLLKIKMYGYFGWYQCSLKT
jgi:dolichyl-phosphate beta-glucosyltransferase